MHDSSAQDFSTGLQHKEDIILKLNDTEGGPVEIAIVLSQKIFMHVWSIGYMHASAWSLCIVCNFNRMQKLDCRRQSTTPLCHTCLLSYNAELRSAYIRVFSYCRTSLSFPCFVNVLARAEGAYSAVKTSGSCP